MTNTADTFAPSPAVYFAAGLGDTPPAVERIDTVTDPDTEFTVADLDAFDAHVAERLREAQWHADHPHSQR